MTRTQIKRLVSRLEALASDRFTGTLKITLQEGGIRRVEIFELKKPTRRDA